MSIKTALITSILTFMCCVGMGQLTHSDKYYYDLGYVKAIDSFYIDFNVIASENAQILKSKENYKMADSIWVSQDSLWLVFRYFKQKEIHDSITTFGGGEILYWNNENFIDSIYHKRDTIKVLLLIGDSVIYNHGYTYDGFIRHEFKGEYHNEVKWIYGYMTYIRNHEYDDGAEWDDYHQYLNDQKEQLREGTIIFNVKYLK